MTEKELRDVDFYLTVFHEDEGLLTPCTLNAYASCRPKPEFVQATLKAMVDPDWVVRGRGARFLGIAKLSDEDGLISADLWAQSEACLLKLLRDSEQTIRGEAAVALGRVAPTIANAKAILPILCTIAEDPLTSKYEMRTVAQALSQFAPVIPEEVVRMAPVFLNHSDSEVVCIIVFGVAHCGSFATPLVPQIRSLARSRDEEIRFNAKMTLEHLGVKKSLFVRLFGW
ncbi:MAG: HEAT repeat domain-containing protein [Planctomycetaceae bacterium]